MTKLFIAVLSLLAGIASSTQGLYNGYWKESIDLKTILLVNAVVVLVCVALFYLLSSKEGVTLSLEKMTPSILVGGICGFFIIMVFAIAFPAIGATATALLFVTGLLIASLAYDHAGALNLAVQGVTLQKVLGLALVLAGTYLALKSPA